MVYFLTYNCKNCIISLIVFAGKGGLTVNLTWETFPG